MLYFAAGEQIRWLHNGNRLDKQTKYVKIGDGELTIRVSEELVKGKPSGEKHVRGRHLYAAFV